MQVDNPKAAKLYTNLINDGYTSKNLGSIDEFSAALNDPVKADKIYNGLISDGYTPDNLGTQKEFMQTFTQRPEGFSAKINQGEPQKPLPFNQEQPEPEQQPEKPTIENNFGLNHDQIALNQQSVSDNTTNVAPKEALQGEYNEAHIPEFNQQKADYKEKVLKATPDAITNAAKKSLQIKGIDPNNAALLNKEKQNFQDQISSGNAAVSFDKDGNPGLVQTPGLFGSLWDHLKTGVTNLKDARDFKNMTDQERVDYANKHPQTPYIGVKPTQAGSVGALIGDIAPTMGRYAAGAAVGGALSTLAPETGGLSTLALKPVMSFALNEGADANISGMNGTLQRFYALRQKNPQGDQVEQMKEARNGEDVDRMAGVATAGLFSMVGNGELGSSVTGNILKKIASVPVKDAETTAASGISKLASNAINSGLSLGEKTSVVEGAKDIGHNLEGVTDKNASNIASDMAQAFAENAPLGTLLDAGIGVLSGVVKAPPIIKSAIKYDLLTKIKPEVFQQALQKGLDGGALTPDQYQKTISSLQEFDNVLKTVPDYLSDESKSSVAGLILKRKSLEQQNETLDPTARKLNQPEIDGINNQINEIYRTGKPLENEINPATGKTFEPPTYDDVAQQQVKDLAQNIAKGKPVEKPEDIQTETKFPDQLKAELQKLSDEEKSADVVGEKPKTVVQDNIKNYFVSRETKNEVNSTSNSESNNSEQNNIEESSPVISKGVENKWNIGDTVPADPPYFKGGKIKSVIKETDTNLKVELENGTKVIIPKDKSKLMDNDVQEIKGKNNDNQETTLKSILDKHEENENDTDMDLVQSVENHLKDNPNPELDKAIHDYWQAYKESKEVYGDRMGLTDDAFENFQKVLDQEIGNEKNKAESKRLNEFKPNEYAKNTIGGDVVKILGVDGDKVTVIDHLNPSGESPKNPKEHILDAKKIPDYIPFKNSTEENNSVNKNEVVPSTTEIKENGENTSTKEQAPTGDIEQSGDQPGESTSEKIKILKKRATPKIKSPLYKKALESEAEDPRSQVLKYFIGGGRISREALKQLYGDSKGELNAKISLQGKDAPKTIDEFAHHFWDNSSEEQQKLYSSEDYREAIESVLGSHNSRTLMAEELVKSVPEDDYFKAMSEWYDKTYGPHSEEIDESHFNDAIDILEHLSDEEIQKLANNEQESLNKWAREYVSESDVKLVQSEHDKAKAKLKDAEDKLAREQGKQSDMFAGGQQAGLFGSSREDSKAILDPLQARVKETKAALDKIQSEFDSQNDTQPKLFEPLNKSEERIAKEQIKKSDAEQIIKDEGLTLENLADYKHLFNGFPFTPEDYQNIKNELNGRTTKSTEAGQESTGAVNDKNASNETPQAESENSTAENTEPEAEKNIGKTAFARSNSYFSYRELHPNESVEDYNKLRASDVEIPTKYLRELSKKYQRERSGNMEAAKQQHYEEIAGSKPNKNTGRIAVDPIIGGDVKQLSEILKDFTTSVKQKILNAKPGRRGAGTYNPTNKGIKLKYSGDLDTTAHEIGHMIDDQHSIIPEIVANPDALKELPYFMDSPAASKPPKGHPNPTRYKQNEGFAEWLRAFVVNPKEAISKAPEIYKIYTSNVDSKMQLAIQNLSDEIRTWAGASGRDQVLSNIEFKPDEAHGLIKKIFSKKEESGNFTVSFADKMAAQFTKPLQAFEKAFDFAKGIKGIDDVLPENDPVILSRLLLGIDGKFGEIIKNGMINSKNEILKTGDGKVKNLEWLLEPLDNSDMKSIENDLKDVVAYMTAERTVELRGRFDRASIISGIGGGIYRDVDVAKKALEEFKTGDPNRLERIEEAASRYREFADDVLKYMRDKGRLSKEQYEAIKKDNLQYVAMKRIFESEPGTELTVVGGKGGKMASVTNPINKIKGSTKKITNPYTSLLESVYTSVREADRNEVLKAFRDMLVETRGMNEGPVKNFADIGVIGKEGDKNAIKIFINGKPENWLFQQDIYKALKGLDHDGWKLPPFIRVLPALLRNTVTMFPTFAARNIVRDTQDRIIKSNASNLKDLFGDKQHWNDVARAGGLNAGFYVKDRAHYYGLLETTMDDLSKNKKFILADPVRLKEVWERYEGLLQKSETVNRVAEYRGRFRKAKKEGMDDYNAMLYSAYHARDLVDFAVAGHFMKIVNQIVPFSNAAVQGIRSGIVKMKENPAGFAARMAIYSILPNAALWYWNHRNKEDGDEYESLPRYQRDLYWNAKIGDNKWLSVPKPYELSLMGAGIDRLLSKIQYGEENAFDGYAGTLYQTLMPVDDANFGAPLTPIVEGVTNHDFFRDKTIIPANEDGLNLALRHTETASRLGHLLQKATGIDGRQIDHFIRGQFSYVGNAAIKLSDIDKDDSKNEFNLTDLGFFKQSPAYNSTPVQDMLKFAEEWNLKTSRDYKDFSKEARNYFDKKTDAEKDEAAKPLVEHAKLLLMKWKRERIDQQKIDKFNSKNKK